MTLKPDADWNDFLQAVHACKGEVQFETVEGDQLNLKSALSQFIFTAVVTGQLKTFRGQILCEEQDLPLLAPFLQD